MVVLHIYATYPPYISYGYENFPPDMSKSVILTFKISYRLWVIGQNVRFFWGPGENKDGRRSAILNPVT